MKALVILMDTLCKKYLGAYGNTWVKTPNIQRLQAKCTVFDSHWTGSAPCMPARRDLITGRINFLERNWGPVEPFDFTLPKVLNNNRIATHMITDHFHYLETGGENYCQSFDTWECFRGQEYDPWVSGLNKPDIPEHYGQYNLQYAANKRRILKEEDYPGVKTLCAANKWLQDNKESDNYLLWVECFDPHEPFDVSPKYLEYYEDTYDGPLFIWPDYAPVKESLEAVEHIRKRYAAKLSMMDHWLGKLLDVIDSQNMWKDTMLIFTSDHGFLLGEHGYMGKNYMHAYNEVFNIPLFVHLPETECSISRITALTQNIDIFPTILEYFGIGIDSCLNKLHGKSLIKLLKGREEKIHDSIIYGYYGKAVNITDGEYTYFRAPANKDNSPLSIYTSSLTTLGQFLGIHCIKDTNRIEMGRFLKWTNFPVYRIPSECINIEELSIYFRIYYTKIIDGPIKFILVLKTHLLMFWCYRFGIVYCGFYLCNFYILDYVFKVVGGNL